MTTPQAAGRLRDYQVEVVDKLEGRPWRLHTNTHPQAGLFYKLALHAPDAVRDALAATQDQRLRNRNREQSTVKNLTAYYIATVRNMCREQGIHVPVRWK